VRADGSPRALSFQGSRQSVLYPPDQPCTPYPSDNSLQCRLEHASPDTLTSSRDDLESMRNDVDRHCQRKNWYCSDRLVPAMRNPFRDFNISPEVRLVVMIYVR
jgi:hypothetical protein